MIFGAISNSWRLQLEAQDLGDLVQQAQDHGAHHVELRQTCLGSYESGEGMEWRPVMSRLQELVDRFPGLTFDLAMALPSITQEIDPQGELFQSALAAAKLVGGSSPHLRTVDSGSFEKAWETPSDIPESAYGLVGLAEEAARQGVILSLENSGQPIGSMALLIEQVRARLSPEAAQGLGLCPDPTNQLRRFPGTSPLGDLDSLPLDMIKIVHFKQARDGNAHPTVDTGDLDCLEMQRVLEDKGYQGQAIMEIPPAQEVFENLAHSFAFLEARA